MAKASIPAQAGGRSDRQGSSLRSFDRSLPMALLRAREAVMRRFRASLRHHGVTEQQWRVLRALNSMENIEVLALADRTFLLAPSLSRILRDLEKRKLIVRRPSPDDLRRGLVSISPRGVALIDRVGTESEAIYAEITRLFGPGKMRDLHGLLTQLETALAGAAPEKIGGNGSAASTPKVARRGARS